MKFNYSIFLLLFILALLALSACLFKQRVSYKLKNRELILQNDSLVSVNLELRRELEKVQVNTLKRKKATAFSK